MTNGKSSHLRRAVWAAVWLPAVLGIHETFGQTKVDLSAQSRQVNFGGATFTIPARTGSGLPATCGVGELYFRTDATAGSNLYGCTAANTWTPQGGGAAGQISASQITDLSLVRSSPTTLTVGGACNPSALCSVELSDILYLYADSKVVSSPSGSGNVWVGVDVDGTRTAWHNLSSLTCAGWRCVSGASGFPSDVVRLGTCSVTSSIFDLTGCADLRAVYGRDAFKAGAGLTRTGNVFSVNAATLPFSGVVTVAFSTTPSFNFASGNLQALTLTGNVTSSTILNPIVAQSIIFKICQDATGGRTFQWPSNASGGMTVGATASTCSVQSFVYDGAKWLAKSAGLSNL